MGKDDKRIDKILSHMGLATRSECKKIIRAGGIAVNGKTVKSAAEKAAPESDVITLYGNPVMWKEYIYLMMNKPDGVVSATEDAKFRTVTDLLAPEDAHFEPYPVGRLDRDTVGLVVLTNDGELAHCVISPKNHIPKTYIAELDGNLPCSLKDEFLKGVTLDDGYVCMPAKLEIDGNRAELTIYEGKFHQVKRMFASYGFTVTFLKRISIGGLRLDENLAEGEYRELSYDEAEALMKEE